MGRVDSLEKTLMLGGMGSSRRRGWQRMRWLDGITDGHESEWTPGVGDGPGGLACCNSWGCKESDTTDRLNWTELMYNIKLNFSVKISFMLFVLECWKVKVKVAQSCPTLCDPMDYTVHGIPPARIQEWVAFPFSRGSSQPRDWTQVPNIVGRFFTS